MNIRVVVIDLMQRDTQHWFEVLGECVQCFIRITLRENEFAYFGKSGGSR